MRVRHFYIISWCKGQKWCLVVTWCQHTDTNCHFSCGVIKAEGGGAVTAEHR